MCLWTWELGPCSVQFSSVVSESLWPHGLQHARLPFSLPVPGIYSNSCPLSWWCHPTISSSVVPFSSCLQSFPASRSFQMSQFFTSGGQSIGASASVLPMNIQDWFPLGLTDLKSFLSEGLSRVFSNTTVQKHQLFGTQLSLWSSSHKGCKDGSILPTQSTVGQSLSRVWLWDPMDCSPPGSCVHGVFQSRILELVAISSSGDLPHPGIKHESPLCPALQADSLPTEPPGKQKNQCDTPNE